MEEWDEGVGEDECGGGGVSRSVGCVAGAVLRAAADQRKGKGQNGVVRGRRVWSTCFALVEWVKGKGEKQRQRDPNLLVMVS
jgi:hypothetical protein